MSFLGAAVLFFGLFTLIFIRMIEPHDIKERRLTQERKAEFSANAGPEPSDTARQSRV